MWTFTAISCYQLVMHSWYFEVYRMDTTPLRPYSIQRKLLTCASIITLHIFYLILRYNPAPFLSFSFFQIRQYIFTYRPSKCNIVSAVLTPSYPEIPSRKVDLQLCTRF